MQPVFGEKTAILRGRRLAHEVQSERVRCGEFHDSMGRAARVCRYPTIEAVRLARKLASLFLWPLPPPVPFTSSHFIHLPVVRPGGDHER